MMVTLNLNLVLLCFCCSECIVERMKHVSPFVPNLLDSETTSESEDEEEQHNDVTKNETDVIINDDNVIELDDDDSECSEDKDKNKDKDNSDSEVDDEEDELVEDKDECDSDVDDDELVVDDFILQNQITDHYLDNWNNVGTPFSSNKIKYLTKTLKKNHYLNVG